MICMASSSDNSTPAHGPDPCVAPIGRLLSMPTVRASRWPLTISGRVARVAGCTASFGEAAK
jgi:hypothetical protein